MYRNLLVTVVAGFLLASGASPSGVPRTAQENWPQIRGLSAGVIGDDNAFSIQAGTEFKVLGSSKLDEMCMATPAVVRGSLIIRTLSKLYRIRRPI